MLSDDELHQIREEHETLERWRASSRHIVASLLEGCAVCGRIREKNHLTRCRWCDDTYYCKDRSCAYQHQNARHPALAHWTW